ncbi:ABC transporter permease [Spiroplasma monobiae]|uniref:ABC transporter permease n=1 Tax=Spiroplasma monobiae MQ-1 TaxID=1336748 RepID=A0A2K9LYX4_SPISQ|nr:ABC transporter permease [Spiroplasma monobiae]AUM62964.1 ABC transporter permease [Spiroplasma monobiae MQ-1]
MKGIRLLLKNAFRSAGKNKSQIIGLSLLVMLVSLVISVLSATTTRVAGAYEKLNVQSNLRDYVVDVNLNNEIKKGKNTEGEESESSQISWDILDKYMVKETIGEEKILLQQYIMTQMSLEHNFDVSFTETRLISGLSGNNGAIKVKAISKMHPNTRDNGVDKLTVSTGRMYRSGEHKEVVIGESYAKENNVKVGDIIRINEDKYGTDLLVKNTKGNSTEINRLNENIRNNSAQDVLAMGEYSNMVWFEVVGIGTSADFTTPLMDQTTVMPNVKTEALVYVDPSWMGYSSASYNFTNKEDNTDVQTRSLSTYAVQKAKIVVASETDREAYFSIKSSDGKSVEQINKLDDQYKQYINVKTDVKYVYDTNDPNYKFSSRTTTFNSIMAGYNAMATGLIVVIIAIAGFTTILTTKKQVELQSRQIGCLKSLGYKKREVVNNFIAIPLIVSVAGALVGYVLAIFIETFVVSVFSNYFNIAFFGFQFNVVSFLSSILGLWLALTLLAFGIGYWTIRLSALTLLKGGDDKVINKFAMKIKSLSSKRRFNPRLRVALLTTSLGKLAGVSATMLLSATLLTTTVVAPKVMSDNMKATFNGMKYENMVEYTQPIANNPFSFYKTYNPNFEGEGWGEYDVNQTIQIRNAARSGGNGVTVPGGWTSGRTAYPVKDTATKNMQASEAINWDQVISELLNGYISPYYYSYDIADKDNFFWAEFSYLDWKNMSTKLLTNLDQASSATIGGSTALGQLQGQWPDYTQLTSADLPALINSNPGDNNLRAYTNTMLRIYNKYINGIKLTFNNNSISNGQINAKGARGNLNKVFTNAPNKKGVNNYWNSSDNNGTAIMDIDVNDTSFEWKDGDKTINPGEITAKDIQGYSSPQLKTLNTALTLWFGAVLDGRMGMAILQTTYTRASYFVQEKMKNALENNENYNITFNLIPYDNKIDELGTVLNTNFTARNGKTESAKIYGIDRNSSLVDLEDYNGNNIKEELFLDRQYGNKIPLIINQSMQKKLGKTTGDTISLDVLQDLMYSDGKEIKYADANKEQLIEYGHGTGNDSVDFTEMRTQSTYGYYSQSNLYSDNPQFPLTWGMDSANIGGANITASHANKATDPIDIYSKYKNGDITIDTNNLDIEFKIVGVQNGYGQSQGWISNQNANEILGYDETQKYNFENWFAREYPAGNPIYKMEGFAGESDEVIQGVNLEQFIEQVILGQRTYEDFVSNVERSKENSSWRNMYKLYNNLFPVFNYKYSNDPVMQDIESGMSVSQRFADFSSVGLNGNYRMIEDPTGEACQENSFATKDDEGQSCMIIDPNNFNEGYGIGSLSTMLPKEQTRQILGQVTDLVNMVMIMFITIAVIVSATIILLTTSLIIYENKQFIATMKTLGYSNPYVVKQILGMYIMPILIMYVAGFLLGWFTFVFIAEYMALNTAWVLPVQFTIWLPFTVFGVIAAIYGVTFGIGWSNIQKINPLEALKDK